MRVCGVDFAGGEARFAIVACEEESTTVSLVPTRTTKLVLNNDQDSAAIRSFMRAADAFVRENNIEVLAIKSRQKRGQMAGGAVSFKMEAILQVLESCNCSFVHPATILSFVKKKSPVFPPELFEYQRAAYYAALHYVDKHS